MMVAVYSNARTAVSAKKQGEAGWTASFNCAFRAVICHCPPWSLPRAGGAAPLPQGWRRAGLPVVTCLARAACWCCSCAVWVQGGVMGYSLVAISMMILYCLALIYREIFSKVTPPPPTHTRTWFGIVR